MFRFDFSQTATRRDNGMWTWLIDSRAVQKIRFNILYQPTVTSLEVVSQSPVHEGLPLEVVCRWRNGNPPVTARLLDRHGAEMNGSIYSKEQIRYKFAGVGCQDAGLIRCEAPGANHNASAMLLVKCPPNFSENASNWTFSLNNGNDVTFSLPVRTHTEQISTCLMSKESDSGGFGIGANHSGMSFSAEKTVHVNCASFSTLSGSPPDLTLSVVLPKVRPEDAGLWKMVLSNDGGDGQLYFHLHVVQDKSTRPAISGHGSYVNSVIFGSIATAVVICVVTIIAISIVCFKKVKRRHGEPRGRQRARRRLETDSEHGSIPALPPLNTTDEDYQSKTTSHIYEEVTDEPREEKRHGLSTPVPCKEKSKRSLRPDGLKKPTFHPPKIPQTGNKPEKKKRERAGGLLAGYLSPVLEDSASEAVGTLQTHEATRQLTPMCMYSSDEELPLNVPHLVTTKQEKPASRNLPPLFRQKKKQIPTSKEEVAENTSNPPRDYLTPTLLSSTAPVGKSKARAQSGDRNVGSRVPLPISTTSNGNSSQSLTTCKPRDKTSS